MAQFYIKDQTGQDILIKELKIQTGNIIVNEPELEDTETQEDSETTEKPPIKPFIINPEMFEHQQINQDTNYTDIMNNIDMNALSVMGEAGMSGAIVSGIQQYLEFTVQSIIATGSANLMSYLGVNQDTLEIANNILSIINNAAFKLMSIIASFPKNINMLPDDSTSLLTPLTATLKDMFLTKWLELEKVYYEKVTNAITNLPSLQEVKLDMINMSIQLATNLIDAQVIEYFGMSLIELIYMCKHYIDLYNEYKRKKKLAREGIETVKERDINYEEVLLELKEELKKCSDVIYNSFLIIQIRESITNIANLIGEFSNVDLNLLADEINDLDDFINMMDEMGVNDESNVIDLYEALKLGFNNRKNIANSLAFQLSQQALASGMTMVNSMYDKLKNAEVTTTYIQNFKFDFDLDNFIIKLIIYKNPLIKSVRRNIINALKNAKLEQNDNKKIFDANQIKIILNAIDEGVFLKKDQEVELQDFKFQIIFELEDYNKGEDEKVYDNTTELYNKLQEDFDKIIEEEKNMTFEQDQMSNYELGIVTEEFTADPYAKKRRPTLKLVHELYAILTKLLPALKIFGTLISNYKINKAKEKANSEGNIFSIIKFLAKANNLLQSIKKTEMNFYTVRTLKMYNYLNDIRIGQETNEETSKNNVLYLNIDETIIFYNYLRDNNLPFNDIDIKLPSVLYIDMDSINDQLDEYKENLDNASQFFGDDSSLFISYPESKYEDGTIDNIDKVMIAGDTIYYSDSSLPIYNSQILLCKSKNYDVTI